MSQQMSLFITKPTNNSSNSSSSGFPIIIYHNLAVLRYQIWVQASLCSCPPWPNSFQLNHKLQQVHTTSNCSLLVRQFDIINLILQIRQSPINAFIMTITDICKTVSSPTTERTCSFSIDIHMPMIPIWVDVPILCNTIKYQRSHSVT